MKIKSLALLLSLSLFCSFTFELDSSSEAKSIIVYDTFKEYKSKKGIPYEGDFKLSSFTIRPGISNRFVTFRNRDKGAEVTKVKIKLKGIWGFSYNGRLMRIHESVPYYVRSKGKVCYYENGYAVINLMNRKKKSIDDDIRLESDSEWGSDMRISKSLNSKMYPFGSKKRAAKFVEKYPEMQEWYDCIFPVKRKDALTKRRECIADFNGN